MPINDFSQNVCARLFIYLRDVVTEVKRARKWYIVNKLIRAFVEICLLIKLKLVKSFTLMKARVKAITELKEALSEKAKLLKLGVERASRISEIALN